MPTLIKETNVGTIDPAHAHFPSRERKEERIGADFSFYMCPHVINSLFLFFSVLEGKNVRPKRPHDGIRTFFKNGHHEFVSSFGPDIKIRR